MAKMMGSGMAAPIGCGGHHEPAPMPKLPKGIFQQVGTGMAEGDMDTTMPHGTSVNMKTGKLQNGE